MADTSSLKEETLVYSFVSYIGHGLFLIRGFVIAVVLDPAIYGVWIFIKNLFDISACAGLGASQSMARQIPKNKAHDSDYKNKQLVSETLGWNLFLATLVIVGFICLNQYFVLIDDGYLLLYVVPIFLMYSIHHFQMHRYKAQQQLLFFSRYKLRFTVLNAGLVIALVLGFGLYGLLIGVGASVFFSLLLLYERDSLGGLAFPSLRRGIKLSADGFPLYINSQLWFFTQTIDRLTVFALLGSSMTGYLGLAGFLGALLREVPLALVHALFPRVIFTFQRSLDRKSVHKYFYQPLYLVTLLVPVLVGFFYLNIDWLIHWAVPKYLDAIPVLKIILFTLFFNAIWMIASNILLALQKEKRQFQLSLFVLGATVLADVLVIRQGGGIVAVAWVGLVFGPLSSILALIYVQWLLDVRRSLQFIMLLKTLLPICYTGLVILWLDQAVLIPGYWPSAVTCNGLWLLAASPLLYLSLPQGSLLKRLRSILD